jgi:hypothetical protein
VINHRAIARADCAQLARWAANLSEALSTPRPPDETLERWEAERIWAAELLLAIDAERRYRLTVTTTPQPLRSVS